MPDVPHHCTQQTKMHCIVNKQLLHQVISTTHHLPHGSEQQGCCCYCQPSSGCNNTLCNTHPRTKQATTSFSPKHQHQQQHNLAQFQHNCMVVTRVSRHQPLHFKLAYISMQRAPVLAAASLAERCCCCCCTV
jgi:hypothetical protein